MPQTEHSESGPKPLDEVLTDAAIRAKVARVVELPSERKDTLWRSLSSNGLVNLVVGFLLTGLLGSWLTARYQSAADAHRRAAELREIHRSERLSTLDTIGAVLNEGYYAY